jgi:hypothetical protein
MLPPAAPAARPKSENRKSLASQCRRARAAVAQARAAGAEPPNWAATSNIHIGVPGRPGLVAVIPAASVTHVPKGRRVSICPCHVRDAQAERDQSAASCPRGPKCPHVHCDAAHVAVYTPHVAPDCTDVDVHDIRCASPPPACFPPTGLAVAVAQPSHDTTVVAHVPTEAMLVTRVFDTIPGGVEGLPNTTSFVATECAHFRNRRRCDRGADCAFAHLVLTPPLKEPSPEPGLPRASLPATRRAPDFRHWGHGGADQDQCSHRGPSPRHHHQRTRPFQHRPYSAEPRRSSAVDRARAPPQHGPE